MIIIICIWLIIISSIKSLLKNIYLSYSLKILKYVFCIIFSSDLTPANKSVLESVLEFVLDTKQANNPYALIQASEVEEIRAHVCKIFKFLKCCFRSIISNVYLIYIEVYI